MLQVHATRGQVRLSMIPPDEKEVERIASWLIKQSRLFAALLEIGIFGSIVANRSRVGLILCMVYMYFSATWLYVEEMLEGFWKEKK